MAIFSDVMCEAVEQHNTVQKRFFSTYLYLVFISWVVKLIDKQLKCNQVQQHHKLHYHTADSLHLQYSHYQHHESNCWISLTCHQGSLEITLDLYTPPKIVPLCSKELLTVIGEKDQKETLANNAHREVDHTETRLKLSERKAAVERDDYCLHGYTVENFGVEILCFCDVMFQGLLSVSRWIQKEKKKKKKLERDVEHSVPSEHYTHSLTLLLFKLVYRLDRQNVSVYNWI